MTLSAPQRPLDAPHASRGRCRVCWRSCALTRRGNAWRHGAAVWLANNSGRRPRCLGSGLPPFGQPGPEFDLLPEVLRARTQHLVRAYPGGTVYLLHLDAPFGHAKHYTGWASDLYGRLAHHGGPAGANLLWHVAKAGIGWQLARTWNGDRYLERRLKRQGGATRRCPVCRPDLAARLLDSSG